VHAPDELRVDRDALAGGVPNDGYALASRAVQARHNNVGETASVTPGTDVMKKRSAASA
jgi:hypothetical protein